MATRYEVVDNRAHGSLAEPWLVVDRRDNRVVCSCMTRGDARDEAGRLMRQNRKPFKLS